MVVIGIFPQLLWYFSPIYHRDSLGSWVKYNGHPLFQLEALHVLSNWESQYRQNLFTPCHSRIASIPRSITSPATTTATLDTSSTVAAEWLEQNNCLLHLPIAGLTRNNSFLVCIGAPFRIFWSYTLTPWMIFPQNYPTYK